MIIVQCSLSIEKMAFMAKNESQIQGERIMDYKIFHE